jgi:hypothetical protein
MVFDRADPGLRRTDLVVGSHPSGGHRVSRGAEGSPEANSYARQATCVVG